MELSTDAERYRKGKPYRLQNDKMDLLVEQICSASNVYVFGGGHVAQILKKHPCYCGVIGSRSKAAGVRKALKEEYGLT